MAEGVQKTSDVLASERTEKAVERTDLAVERTVMAANRTLMAWVRTALSLISFGFTMYKFLQAEMVKVQNNMKQWKDPKNLGLFLIALGTVSVILGTIEYFQTIKRLDKLSPRDYKPYNYTLLVGFILGLLGIFLFITILTHNEVF